MVSTPGPPCMRSSPPRPCILSLFEPPWSRSWPASPSM
jgi:hypothetical protein